MELILWLLGIGEEKVLGFVPEREKVFLGNGISQDECLVLILALVVDDKAFLEHPKKFFLIPPNSTDSNHFQSTIPFPQISHNFEKFNTSNSSELI